MISGQSLPINVMLYKTVSQLLKYRPTVRNDPVKIIMYELKNTFNHYIFLFILVRDLCLSSMLEIYVFLTFLSSFIV